MEETTHPGGVRQRRSAEEWRGIFERQAASGLPAAAFCQREGIAHSSYARWRTQLAHAARDAGAAPSPIGAGFVDAGVLAHRVTADTAERIRSDDEVFQRERLVDEDIPFARIQNRLSAPIDVAPGALKLKIFEFEKSRESSRA